MKNFFQSMSQRINTWMQGRYGPDELSRAILWFSLILTLVALVSGLNILSTIALMLLLWSIFRSYSKNLYKRRLERNKWLHISAGVKSWFSLQNCKWRDRRDYKYFRCKSCKHPLRVPKGKGTIRISCPKCHHEVIKRT